MGAWENYNSVNQPPLCKDILNATETQYLSCNNNRMINLLSNEETNTQLIKTEAFCKSYNYRECTSDEGCWMQDAKFDLAPGNLLLCSTHNVRSPCIWKHRACRTRYCYGGEESIPFLELSF